MKTHAFAETTATRVSAPGAHLQLRGDALRELLSVGFEQLGRRLERFEVLLVAELPVSHRPEMAHDLHQTCVVAT